MATMNISLPDPMRDSVKSQINALQEAIDEGLASGDAGELNMNAIIQEAKRRAKTDA